MIKKATITQFRLLVLMCFMLLMNNTAWALKFVVKWSVNDCNKCYQYVPIMHELNSTVEWHWLFLAKDKNSIHFFEEASRTPPSSIIISDSMYGVHSKRVDSEILVMDNRLLKVLYRYPVVDIQDVAKLLKNLKSPIVENYEIAHELNLTGAYIVPQKKLGNFLIIQKDQNILRCTLDQNNLLVSDTIEFPFAKPNIDIELAQLQELYGQHFDYVKCNNAFIDNAKSYTSASSVGRLKMFELLSVKYTDSGFFLVYAVNKMVLTKEEEGLKYYSYSFDHNLIYLYKEGKLAGPPMFLTSRVSKNMLRRDDQIHLFGNKLYVGVEKNKNALPYGNKVIEVFDIQNRYLDKGVYLDYTLPRDFKKIRRLIKYPYSILNFNDHHANFMFKPEVLDIISGNSVRLDYNMNQDIGQFVRNYTTMGDDLEYNSSIYPVGKTYFMLNNDGVNLSLIAFYQEIGINEVIYKFGYKNSISCSQPVFMSEEGILKYYYIDFVSNRLGMLSLKVD
jgi:hypothetical protein